MGEYNLCNHPNEDHEWLAAIEPCKRCGATPGGDEHNCFSVKPMKLAPRSGTLMAIHYERGQCEIRPDDEMDFWTAHICGERSWFVDFDDEGPSRPDSEFVGWFLEVET